jgi:hypothetical protein
MSFHFMPHLGAMTISVSESLFVLAAQCYSWCLTLHLAYESLKRTVQLFYT